MKVILVILCGLAVLFAGGCLVVLGSEPNGIGSLGLPVFGILCFNGFFLWAAYSTEKWSGIALIVCGIVDLGIAVFMLAFLGDQYVGPIAAVAAGLFALKGLSGIMVGYRRKEPKDIQH